MIITYIMGDTNVHMTDSDMCDEEHLSEWGSMPSLESISVAGSLCGSSMPSLEDIPTACGTHSCDGAHLTEWDSIPSLESISTTESLCGSSMRSVEGASTACGSSMSSLEDIHMLRTDHNACEECELCGSHIVRAYDHEYESDVSVIDPLHPVDSVSMPSLENISDAGSVCESCMCGSSICGSVCYTCQCTCSSSSSGASACDLSESDCGPSVSMTGTDYSGCVSVSDDEDEDANYEENYHHTEHENSCVISTCFICARYYCHACKVFETSTRACLWYPARIHYFCSERCSDTDGDFPFDCSEYCFNVDRNRVQRKG
jgi:hypothetical protein